MKRIDALVDRYPALLGCREQIEAATERIIDCYRAGGTVLLCGNGGSCADAQHIAGELMKGFCKARPLDGASRARLIAADAEIGGLLAAKLQSPLKAVCLSDLQALGTAFANDVDPTLAFAQQAYAFAGPGDVLLGLSTSGNAKNVLAAAVAAKARGAHTIGLTGADGGKMNDVFDTVIKVPERETYRIQELHLPVYHAVCLEVEDAFFDE